MGFLDRFKRAESRALDSHALMLALLAGNTAKSGVNVTPETAIASAAVAACLGIRATAFSTLPVHLYRATAEGREKAVTHPAYRLLKDSPNESMTAAKFWRWKQLTQDLYGNAYALIERDSSGQVRAIRPLLGTVTPVVDYSMGAPKVLGYEQELHLAGAPSVKKEHLPGDVMHFPSEFIKPDGVTGRSLIDVCKEAVGLDIGSEEFFARVLANGTHMGTVLIANNEMTDEQFKNLQEQMADGRGVAPAGKVRMFRNAEPKVLGMSIKDAELIEQRRFQIERICNVSRIPVIMLDPSHGTYSNTEQGDLALGKHCIRPICVDTEQVVNSSVLRSEVDTYIKFDLNGLTRGDFKTRMEGYAQGVNGGWMRPNEPRELEEMDPIPGGDIVRFPLNAIPSDDAGVYTLKAKAEAAGALVRAGFDANEVLSTVGLPNMAYNDVQPVTVRPVDDDGVQIAPADAEPTQRALSVVYSDAIERIKSRKQSDAQRGRDSTDFAKTVLSTVGAAYTAAGLMFDEEAALKEALA